MMFMKFSESDLAMIEKIKEHSELLSYFGGRSVHRGGGGFGLEFDCETGRKAFYRHILDMRIREKEDSNNVY